MRVLPRFSIEELASKAGVSRRTVRYYIQRGLLPEPYGLGRGRHYGEEHLAALLQVKQLQERGLGLGSIRESLVEAAHLRTQKCDTELYERGPVDRQGGGSARSAPVPPGEGWFRQRLFGGYELHSAAGARPLSAGELAALSEFLRDLMERGGG